MTLEQAKSLRRIGAIVIEAVSAADPTIGAPGGILYAALMGHGCSLEQFTGIMAGLTRAGMLDKRGECYHVTDKGRQFAAM